MSSRFRSHIVQLLLLLVTFSFTSSFNICSNISNVDCRCSSSSASSSQPDIRCKFLSRPPSPLFSDKSQVPLMLLRTLDLSENDLEDLPDDFFQNNKKVTVGNLVLRKNNFTKIPAVLTNLASLAALDMSDNKVDSLSLGVLSAVPGLQRLDLSDNRLSNLSVSLGEQDLQLQSLGALNLSRNIISSIDGKVFTSMSSLIILDLSHNQLTALMTTTFSRLRVSLVSLDLSHNALRHITNQTLQPLQHLRQLNLAHNPLTDVNHVRFPQHLQSLDLSHTALTILNHCYLSGLADLSFIGLSGNDLRCTCQLYLLLQWYQNQYHNAGNLNAGTMGSNWTCTNQTSTPTPTSSPSPTGSLTTHHPTLVSDSLDNGVRKVAELEHCTDTESHCQTLEHSPHHLKGSSQIELTLDVASSGDTLMASWTLEENGEVVVDGFVLRYMPEDGDVMTSPVIPAELRSFAMKTSGLEKHFVVCLDVLAYDVAVVHQECHNFKDESGNVVVGILAGVVFLVPCIVAMVYVLLKDRKLSKPKYEEIKGKEKDIEQASEDGDCVFQVNGASQLNSNGTCPDEKAKPGSDASSTHITNVDVTFLQSTVQTGAGAPEKPASVANGGTTQSAEDSSESGQSESSSSECSQDSPAEHGADNPGFCGEENCHHDSTNF